MSRRSHFDDADDSPADIPAAPRRAIFRCAAHNCPMPGTVFLGADGVCGWHCREQADDWPRITQILRDWECVVRVINRGRRVLTDPQTCASPKAHNLAMTESWAELKQATLGSGWQHRTQPKPGEMYGSWVRRMEVFLGARVKSALLGGREVDEAQPTPFAAEVRAGLRNKPVSETDDWKDAA